MRLIDADVLLKAIADSGLVWETNDCIDVIELLAVKKIIDDAPTVDTTFKEVVAYECGQKAVEERPKGKWVEDSGNIACSHCHIIWLYRKTDFCPNCGADMKGDEK